MGITEVGLNLFTETPELTAIRTFATKNKEFMKEVFGDLAVAPSLMYYYPERSFIEILSADSQGYGDIVITNLENVPFPLVRYNSKDFGKILDQKTLTSSLTKYNAEYIKPQLPLPLIAVAGRASDTTTSLSPATVKQALYMNHEVASKVTGHFMIHEKTQTLEIQLKENTADETIKPILSDICKSITQQYINISLIPYQSFKQDMYLDYERKWKHLSHE